MGFKQRLLSGFYRETSVRAETESKGSIAVSVLCPLNVVSVALLLFVVCVSLKPYQQSFMCLLLSPHKQIPEVEFN